MTKRFRKERHQRDVGVNPRIGVAQVEHKPSSRIPSSRRISSRSGREVGISRRSIGVVVGVLVLLGALWCYFGPVLRVRSIVVLGGSVAQRTSSTERLTAMLVHRHVWSVSAARVVDMFALAPQLRGEVRLRALEIHWPSSVVVELSQVPLLSRLQKGYVLTKAGVVAAPASTMVGSKLSVCPVLLSVSSLSCRWQPRIGEELPARLVDVVVALLKARQHGSSIGVYEVHGLGVVLHLSGSRECILGSANQPRAQVHSCLGFSTPGAVLDVINPNSPAVLLNDRVG